jgi:hypothetical protein
VADPATAITLFVFAVSRNMTVTDYMMLHCLLRRETLAKGGISLYPVSSVAKFQSTMNRCLKIECSNEVPIWGMSLGSFMPHAPTFDRLLSNFFSVESTREMNQRIEHFRDRSSCDRATTFISSTFCDVFRSDAMMLRRGERVDRVKFSFNFQMP